MSVKKVVIVKESLTTGKKTFMEYPEKNVEKYSLLGMVGGFRYRLATLKEVEELQKSKGKTLVEKKPRGEDAN